MKKEKRTKVQLYSARSNKERKNLLKSSVHSIVITRGEELYSLSSQPSLKAWEETD